MKLTLSMVVAVLSTCSLLAQQNPRNAASREVGGAKLTLDYGQPSWSDDRLQQLEAQIPVGRGWRLGADFATNLTVEGAPVRIGGKILGEGEYGLNAFRKEALAWDFVAYDLQSPFDVWFRLPRPHTMLTATFTKNEEVRTLLELTFDQQKDALILCFAFGPIRLRAPVQPVQVKTTQVSFGGHPATWQAFEVPVERGDLQEWTLAAQVVRQIEDEERTLRLYLQADGDVVVARFRDLERERFQQRVDSTNSAREAFKEFLGFLGIDTTNLPQLKEFDRRAMKAEIMLEELAAVPDEILFRAPLQTQPKVAPLSTSLELARHHTVLNIRAADFSATVPIDSQQFVPAAED
jgi:hypothetical protein